MKTELGFQLIGISKISVILLQLSLLRQFKVSFNKYESSMCSNRNFEKLQKDKDLHQLCNQTEGLLFLLTFYKTHTVTRAAARGKIQQTLITNMFYV